MIKNYFSLILGWILNKNTISGLLEVDIGVAEAPTSNHVPANTDAQHWSSGTKLFEKHGLGHLLHKTNILVNSVFGSFNKKYYPDLALQKSD